MSEGSGLESHGVWIAINDAGRGIPDNIGADAFDRFFTSRSWAGGGLPMITRSILVGKQQETLTSSRN